MDVRLCLEVPTAKAAPKYTLFSGDATFWWRCQNISGDVKQPKELIATPH